MYIMSYDCPMIWTAKSRLQQYTQDFSGERALDMFGGPFLEGWDKFYYWEGPEVWGIIQIFA